MRPAPLYVTLFIGFIFFSCNRHNKIKVTDVKLEEVKESNPLKEPPAPPPPIQPYDYDTTLKGSYTILFKEDDSLEYLYLKKGSKIITELSSCSRGLLYKNLGYVAADFQDYFVLAHSYGSRNPHYIELIKKATGKNILKKGAAWIDAVEKKDILLYSDNDAPSLKDKMTLYNVRTGQKQFFSFPSELADDPEILNTIQIGKLTAKQLVIKYDTEDGPRTKRYSL